ncbi:hypothetical protein V6N13_083474 [Hibiscus sabdariffa]
MSDYGSSKFIGVGDIKVKHIDDYQYLIEIRDMELFKMLEDLQWSYLKEVFLDVLSWSASFKSTIKMTWVMVFGLPAHYWNTGTVKNLASIWGYLKGLRENANQIHNCERPRLLKHGDRPFKSTLASSEPKESSSKEVVFKNVLDLFNSMNEGEISTNSLGESELNGDLKSNDDKQEVDSLAAASPHSVYRNGSIGSLNVVIEDNTEKQKRDMALRKLKAKSQVDLEPEIGS